MIHFFTMICTLVTIMDILGGLIVITIGLIMILIIDHTIGHIGTITIIMVLIMQLIEAIIIITEEDQIFQEIIGTQALQILR